MKIWDIVLLTEDRYCNPTELNPYINNILTDDAILTSALEEHGLRVIRKSWSDNSFDWSTAHYVVFRTTWDYFDRFAEFEVWLNATAEKTQFINSINLLKWNLDKHYFRDLLQAGVNTVETYYFKKGTSQLLSNLFVELKLNEAVLKPTISGSARHTYRLNLANVAKHNDIFSELIQHEDMMLQPFQYDIINKGEVAFMLMNGIFTHAVLKKSKPGDFRVQDDFGGTLHDYTPTSEEIAFAEKAVAACSEKPLYARVDIINDNNGQLAVMELEIIEPELWFRRNPLSANFLASAIKNLFK
jgi:glutathione synthase/RimK-type ligase-like ATP-grasp enzyme